MLLDKKNIAIIKKNAKIESKVKFLEGSHNSIGGNRIIILEVCLHDLCFEKSNNLLYSKKSGHVKTKI